MVCVCYVSSIPILYNRILPSCKYCVRAYTSIRFHRFVPVGATNNAVAQITALCCCCSVVFLFWTGGTFRVSKRFETFLHRMLKLAVGVGAALLGTKESTNLYLLIRVGLQLWLWFRVVVAH